MKKVLTRFAVAGWFGFLIIAFCLVSLSAVPAFSADKAIAKLTSFSGTVLIKSKGAWGVNPEKDLPLYSDDKVVTKMGTATIAFNDGAVIEIKANSNLLIRETEESGVSRQLGAAKRQLRLLIGKMLFRSGKGSSVSTSLETTTMVCGLRGTAGTLSIDAAGQIYLQFTEGGGDTIGKYISGVAADVPPELVDLDSAQRAAYIAALAAGQAKRAAEKLARGEATDAEAALAAAEAAKAAAQEVKAAAEAMLNNPDESIRNEALRAIAIADEAIKTANEAIDLFLNGRDDNAVLGDSYGILGDPLTRQVYNLTLQGIENNPPPSVGEGEPPVVNLTNGPGTFNNSNNPVFAFTADEAVTYSYKLDGGAAINLGASPDGTISFTLNGLSEGNHSLELIARDANGLETSKSYSWISDYTAPTVALSAAPGISGATIAGQHTNSEPGTVTYTFSGATTGLADGNYGISVIAIDQAGNVSTPTTFTFVLKNEAFQGKVSGTGSVITGDASGAAAVILSQNWGGWKTDLSGTWSGTHTGSLSLASGGTASDGQWISLTSGSIGSGGAATGTTSFILLTDTSVSLGDSLFNGTFNADHTWTGTDTGSGLRNIPLLMSGLVGTNDATGFINYSGLVIGADFIGSAGVYLDGDSLKYVMLGDYFTSDSGSEPYLAAGVVFGNEQIGGPSKSALVPTIWENGVIDGFLVSTYQDLGYNGTAGIFDQRLSGNYYVGIGSETGMWKSQGSIDPVEMASGVGQNGDTRYFDTASANPLNFTIQEGSNFSINSLAMGDSIPTVIRKGDGSVDMLFGVWSTEMVGSYETLPTNGWSISLRDDYNAQTPNDIMGWMEIGPGATDSTWAANHSSASAYGSWVSLGDMTTGVLGGKLIGTFDPDLSAWQAVAAGAFVDTKTFLAMADTPEGRAKLARLDIPNIQVGSTSLTGSGGVMTSVAMNDVKFFAYKTGDAPKVWATGDVNGTVSVGAGSPEGTSVNLTGTGFSNVSFYMSNYDTGTGRWIANVSGSGAVSDHNIAINGDAAGNNATSTGFSGTGSGVARPYNPQ
jgi:hypothetical protein